MFVQKRLELLAFWECLILLLSDYFSRSQSHAGRAPTGVGHRAERGHRVRYQGA